LKFKADFHSPMSVCRRELGGGVQPPPTMQSRRRQLQSLWKGRSEDASSASSPRVLSRNRWHTLAYGPCWTRTP